MGLGVQLKKEKKKEKKPGETHPPNSRLSARTKLGENWVAQRRGREALFPSFLSLSSSFLPRRSLRSPPCSVCLYLYVVHLSIHQPVFALVTQTKLLLLHASKNHGTSRSLLAMPHAPCPMPMPMP
ncbi:hypothetical protein LZ31DRAFT_203006 [Colletotrichum somersetense]|nr:hypothetical protein LZ31DRAFT_203006 [Colletotrichum somersetense]